MPLLMDEDLDDLFGDHGDDPSLQIPSSMPKELLQHVDDLRLTGCCQRIAWSKTGCIATIDGDGHGVSTRQLFCDQGSGKWALSKPISIKGVPTLHCDYPIIHLSWNHQGHELAVFDSMGRISIFTLLFTLSDFSAPRKCVIDTDDPLGVVVGLIWLNNEKPHMFQESARREEGHWKISSTQQTPLGPHNPNSGMSALVTITRGGMIRLLLQGRDRTWQEAKTELDTYSVPADLLTHATIAANKDSTLLVTIHTTDHQLRFYCVGIDFQRLSFSIQHLKIVTDCFPKGGDTGGPEGTGWYPNACLTHLEYFPQGPESRKGEPSLPFVLGSFTDTSDQHQNNGSHEPFSVVCRWELQSTKPKFHPNFENLGPKRSTAPKHLAADITIKRLPDTFIPKIFLYVQQMRLSTILAIAFHDGTVEIRDRLTMEIIAQDNIREEVFGLGQIGFEFVPDTLRLHVTLSPNFCAMASLNDSSEITLGLLQIPPAISFDKALMEATVEALILHFTSACTSHGQYADDLLSVMQLLSEQHPEHSIDGDFLNEVYRALDVRLDHVIEPQVEWLFKNLMIQKCLGMQLSLGYNGEDQPRMLRAKIAQGFLDIRLATLIITYSIKNVLAVAGTDARKADELHAITGSVAWTMFFIGFVVNELFNLNLFLQKDPSTNHTALQSHIHATNTPALPLLLISSSRSLLKYLCRSLHALTHEARSSAPNTGPQRAAFHALVSTLRESPVQVLHFEKILSELDSSIRSAYQSASVSDTDRKATEKRMLVGGEVPEVLMPAVRTLLGKGVEGLREEVDVAELHFADFAWLGLGGEGEESRLPDEDEDGDGVGRLRRETVRVDAVRKVVLGPEARVRRCTRCFALMEDKPPATRNVGILQSVRMCLCGDWWMHMESVGE